MTERRTIKQLMEENRIKAGALNYEGHDFMAIERFLDTTKHMIIFDVITNQTSVGDKGDRMRLYLSEDGYQKALDEADNGDIKIITHAAVLGGRLRYDNRNEEIR